MKTSKQGKSSTPYFEKAFDNYFNTQRLSNKIDAGLKLASNRYLNVLAAYSVFDRRKEEFYKDLTTLSENLVEKDTTRFYSLMLRTTFSKSDKNSKIKIISLELT